MIGKRTIFAIALLASAVPAALGQNAPAAFLSAYPTATRVFSHDENRDDASEPVITSEPVTDAVVGIEYQYKIRATGRPTPRYTLVSGPAGMTVQFSSGVVKWIPEAAGEYTVAVAATNSDGSDIQEYILTVHVSSASIAPSITTSPVSEGVAGAPYTYDVDASGEPSPAFTLLDGPDGMTIDTLSGVISWTPSVSGSYPVSVRAENEAGSDTQDYLLAVSARLLAPVITSMPPIQAFTDLPYVYTVKAEANPAPTFSFLEAPAGMTIDPDSGIVSWTPAQPGSFDVVIQAANQAGSTEQAFTLVVSAQAAAPVMLSTPVTQALVGVVYRYDAEATGNPAPVFALPDAPAGMTVDPASGVISWLPDAPGNYAVTLEAQNSEGAATQQFTIMVGLPGSAPLMAAPAARITGPNAVTLTSVVNPSGSPTRVTFEFGIERVDEFSVNAVPDIVEGFADREVTARLTGLQEGATYSYRATAENQVGQVVGDVQTFTTYFASYDIAAQKSFSGRVDSMAYRMFSIPGNVDLDAAQTLQGAQGEDWGIFRDNGRPADYFEAYDGSDAFHFRPGRGFWMLAKTNWTVAEQTVATAPLDPTGAFQLPLQPGWNIVSSPFLQPVTWAAVRASSPSASPTAKLWTFNGSFREADSMLPYEAYYYFHDGLGEATLSIPYPGLPTASKLHETTEQRTPAVSGLTLEAAGFDSLRVAVDIVFDERAAEEADRYDQYAPRNGFSRLALSIAPAFNAPYGLLALDARPNVQHGTVFDLLLDAEAGERIQLHVQDLRIRDDLHVFFVNGATGEFVDLHAQSALSIYPEDRRTRHRLVVGNQAFVDDQRVQLAPAASLLLQNYPNPFSGATTISYALSESGHVDLSVYDVLGRKVMQLVRSVQPAGFHSIALPNSADLPNGVYFVRLRAPDGGRRVVSMTKVR